MHTKRSDVAAFSFADFGEFPRNARDAFLPSISYLIRYRVILTSINESLYFISAKLIILICLLTLVMTGYQLTAEAAFVTITMLDSLRLNMTFFFPFAVASIAELVVSCDRLRNFLLLGEQPKESKIKVIKRFEDEINGTNNHGGGLITSTLGKLRPPYVCNIKKQALDCWQSIVQLRHETK